MLAGMGEVDGPDEKADNLGIDRLMQPCFSRWRTDMANLGL